MQSGDHGRALGIRTVAVIEMFKGVLVLVVGAGLLNALHHDARHFAEKLVGHLHLNPAKHDPQVFIDAMSNMDDSRLTYLAAMGAAYASFRLAEGWGLWFGKPWAEWLAVVTGCIYIPFEILELAKGITPLRVSMFLVNLLIVGVMIHALLARRKRPASAD